MLRATLTSGTTSATAEGRCNSAAVQYGGTFSTGTVTIHARPNGVATFEALTGTAFAEAQSFVIDVAPTWELKAIITGAGGSDSVTVSIDRIVQ
jgi:hypothetical protein